MSNNSIEGKPVGNKIESIITNVLESRNHMIRQLLKDEGLLTYIRNHYGEQSISSVRMEFLKRALREHLSTPLDLVHYSSLIKQFRNDSVNIQGPIESDLFDMELLPVLNKYINV